MAKPKKQVTPTSAVSSAPMDRRMDEAIKLVRATVSEKRTARQTVRKVIERLQQAPLQLVAKR